MSIPYQDKVAAILQLKLANAGLNPADQLTDEEIAQVIMLTQEAEEEAGSL